MKRIHAIITRLGSFARDVFIFFSVARHGLEIVWLVLRAIWFLGYGRIGREELTTEDISLEKTHIRVYSCKSVSLFYICYGTL